MRYINVEDDFVNKVLQANKLMNKAKNLNEAQDFEVFEEGQVEEHVCPLCESELDQPIPEENLQECVDFILGTLNEALEIQGEYLEESEEDEEYYDIDEEYEVGTDEDEDDCNEEPKQKRRK
jgi:hypothetical protein